MLPMTIESHFDIGQCATLACLLECSVPKPGNVHRGADFEDMSFYDFAASAAAIGPVMQAATVTGSVGRVVLSAVEATRVAVAKNTNLGTVLLLAPLAMVPTSKSLPTGVAEVLGELTKEDASLVYEAIRVASPGGIGEVDEMDVQDAPPGDLLVAMQAAAERDLVARQYANGFQEVLGVAVPWLGERLANGWALVDAVVGLHIHLMAEYPDSLIARKSGEAVAEESARRARQVEASGLPSTAAYQAAVADLDFWLRSDSKRRNPGTTADLIAASLFVALRDGIIELPLQMSPSSNN